MKLLLPITCLVVTFSVTAGAQDSKIKTQDKIKADDAKLFSMTGCLRNDPVTNTYTLVGTIAAAGDDLKTKSTVKTDVDDDKTKVQAKTESKGDDKAVGTAGALTTYALLAGPDVNLAKYAGQQVQISSLMVEKGHGDADVQIKQKTRVDAENAPDSKSQSKTKIEADRSPQTSYTVVSVTPLGTVCVQ